MLIIFGKEYQRRFKRHRINSGNDVRITDKEGNPWFIAQDVCDILDLKNVSWATKALHDKEKMNLTFSELQSPGRGGDTGKRIIISESGLYKLILKSRKKEAVEFQDWVTREVLPQIRKTGGPYNKVGNPDVSLTFLLLKSMNCNDQPRGHTRVWPPRLDLICMGLSSVRTVASLAVVLTKGGTIFMTRKPRKKKKPATERYMFEVKDWEMDYSFGINTDRYASFYGNFFEYSMLSLMGKLVSPVLIDVEMARIEIHADHWSSEPTSKPARTIGMIQLSKDNKTITLQCGIPFRPFAFISTAAAFGKIKHASAYGEKLRWRRGSVFNFSLSTTDEDD